MKRESAISVDVGTTYLTFKFADGTSRMIQTSSLNSAILERATLHGLEQKIRDAAALGYETINGKLVRPTDADKKAAVLAMIDRLESGEWNKRTGEGGETGSMLYRAMLTIPRYASSKHLESAATFAAWIKGRAEAQGVSVKAITDALATQQADIKAALDAIRAAKVANVDTDDILNGF